MTITPSLLLRGAAAAAVTAGLLFIGIQLGHPPLTVDTVAGTEMLVRDSLKVLMAALALAGITGIYLRQVDRTGLLGLIGYLVLAIGYLLIATTTAVTVYVLPHLAATEPAYVTDVLTAAAGHTPAGDLGLLGIVLKVQGFAYLVGGAVLGIALYRAGVLARWAAALLAVGGLVSVALTLMPDAFYRLLAFPNGIAMIGLGWSLWRSLRPATEVRATGRVDVSSGSSVRS
jgi:hypothetical protein